MSNEYTKQLSMMNEVHNLLRLYFTIPPHLNDLLQLVLTYLPSSMSEHSLNNCILLRIHKQLTDSCDLLENAKQFVSSKIERMVHLPTLNYHKLSPFYDM